jgi:hypothetical protein
VAAEWKGRRGGLEILNAEGGGGEWNGRPSPTAIKCSKSRMNVGSLVMLLFFNVGKKFCKRFFVSKPKQNHKMSYGQSLIYFYFFETKQSLIYLFSNFELMPSVEEKKSE